MKKNLLAFLLLPLLAFGAQQAINTGSSPNDGSGDTLRTGGAKINANFSEVYSNLSSFPGGNIAPGTINSNALDSGTLAWLRGVGGGSGGNGLLNNLVADYEMDETNGSLMDSSTNGNNLTPVGSPAYSQSGPGGGTSIGFDGSSRFDAATSFGPSGDQSYSFWEQNTINNDGSDDKIWSANHYTSGADDNGINIEFDSRDGGNQGQIDYSDEHSWLLSTANNLSDGGWHLIVYTVSSASVKLYIDGSLSQDCGPPGGPLVQDTPPSIGANNVYDLGQDGLFFGFNGNLSKFRVWSAVLTPDQVTALYNSGAGLPFSSFTH